jgi:hypothetical protein
MNANAIGVTLVVAMLGAGDYHARARDAIIEAIEPLRLLADCRLECIGMLDVLEDDLEGCLHWWDSPDLSKQLCGPWDNFLGCFFRS